MAYARGFLEATFSCSRRCQKIATLPVDDAKQLTIDNSLKAFSLTLK
jgi:hypothetical protein